MAGRPLGLGASDEQNASAILMAYQGGTETGQAVAEVVFGVVNPSGHLPVSWPTDAETRAPFGSGGDFNGRRATFSIDGLAVSGPARADGSVTAPFTVTNTGGRAGAEVVPVFVHQATSQIVVPPYRLVAFARVELEPGESRSVNLEFPLLRLATTPR